MRGNACVSRRQIVSSNKREDKAKIIEKFKIGDIIKDAVVKDIHLLVVFEVNNETRCFSSFTRNFIFRVKIILMRYLILAKNMT